MYLVLTSGEFADTIRPDIIKGNERKCGSFQCVYRNSYAYKIYLVHISSGSLDVVMPRSKTRSPQESLQLREVRVACERSRDRLDGFCINYL